MDEPYEMLDAGAMRVLTGIDYYSGGLFTPGAAMIQPAAFVRGVARGLESDLMMIHEMSPVTRLERRNAAWVAFTQKGTATAPKVILAVNGHVESFGFFRRRLMRVLTYASMTRPLEAAEVEALGGVPDWSCTPADPMGTTLRRISGTGGDRIIVRNRFTYDPSIHVTDTHIAAVARDHDRAFRARFPMLAGVEMAYRWGGRLCLSRNGAPAFGIVEDGLYSACCQNGLGTAKGTLSGMLAADLAAGANFEPLEQMLCEPQPSLLPPGPIARIGASLVIRWGEMRSGKEL